MRFTDKNREAVEIVKENLSKCGFMQSARVLNIDSLEYLRVAKPGFDIALLDPPYRMGLLEKALPELDKKMNVGGLVVCEHEKELTLNDSYGRLSVRKCYKYGKIAVTVFEVPAEEEDI